MQTLLSTWICVVLTCSLVPESYASHFRGAMIFWKENSNGAIDIDYRESWRRTSQSPQCNETDILNGENVTAQGSLQELYSYGGFHDTYTPFAEPFSYVCTDVSLAEDWQTGRGQLVFPYNVSSGRTSYTIQFSGCCWIDSLVEGGGSSWLVQVTMNTTVRPDTGRMNQSPRVDFSPILRLAHGCNHTIRLPVSDDDDDTVKCRWADSSESAGIYHSFTHAHLDENTCTVTYDAKYQSGWYAAAIQIEDFNPAVSSGPLSSVPLQFLVSVEDTNRSCEVHEKERPKFVNFTLPDRACVGVDGSTEFTADISIQSSSEIAEVNTISPIGLVKSSLSRDNNSDQWHVSVHWNPNNTDSISNVFCFTAVDVQGLSSDQRCVTLLVGFPPAEVVQGTNTPANQMVAKTQSTWSIEFNRDDNPTSKPAYIYLYLRNGTLVETIDVHNTTGTRYTVVNNRTRLQFTTTATLEPSAQYYFLLGQGLVQGKTHCGVGSKAVLDRNFWTFSVLSDPTTSTMSTFVTTSFSPYGSSGHVNVKCFRGYVEVHCNTSMLNCTDIWRFTSPCTRENILAGNTKFAHPTDLARFIMCDLSGKTYVASCPLGELFYPSCSQCATPDQAIVSGCDTRVVGATNPCSRENILAGKLFFPYPGNSSKYIHCDIWGHAWERSCPGGEIWDDVDKTCIAPPSYDPCKQHGLLSQTLFPHECDPHKFVHCDGNGQSFVQMCQSDFVFLPSALTCVPQGFPGSEDLRNTCA